MPNGPPVCCTHTIAVNHSMILVCLFIGSLKNPLLLRNYSKKNGGTINYMQ